MFDLVNLAYPQKLEITFSPLALPLFREIEVTSSLVVSEPQWISFDELPQPLTEDLYETFLRALLDPPDIEDLKVLLGVSRTEGKVFASPGNDQLQFDSTQSDVQKSAEDSEIWWKTRKKKEHPEPKAFDVFDLVFPFLLPPLNDDFEAPLALPPGASLYPFQRTGVDFLLRHDEALLADDMGLGKSIQVIVALKLLLRMGRIQRCLIVCPKAVQTDWERKLENWAPEFARKVKISGGPEQRRIHRNTDAYIYIVTYETLLRDFSERDSKTWAGKLDLVILDEAQKIKNPAASITQGIKRNLKTKMRWALTGTPLENKIDDVVSIFSYIKPGLLNSKHTSEEVRDRIQPFTLRRRKKDALTDLPEKVVEEVWLDLTPTQREAYDQAEQEGVINLKDKGETVTIHHVLQLINMLKQICNMHPDDDTSCKADYLQETLEEITDEGDKALVFSQYPNVTLARLKDKLNKYAPLLYEGGLSERQRDRMLDSFDKESEHSVLLLSVKSGGTGLTLTRANYVFHYDLWWNPAVARQAEDRAYRIGQKKTVFVNILLTTGTIEERIHEILARKQRLFDAVIDEISDDELQESLTEEELFGLLGLAPPSRRVRSRGPISDDLNNLSPTEFEKLTGTLYEAMGFAVKLTPATRDGGVDLYAKRISAAGRDHIAIQCKHKPNSRVSRPEAQALYGVISADQSLTKGIIVTSGDFSSDCRDFVQGKRIELINGGELRGYLQKFNIKI